MEFISSRIKTLEESATLQMTKKSRALVAEGIKVVNLSIGEPDFDTPAFIKNAAKQAIDNNFTHYPPVAGFMELRAAISKKLLRDQGIDCAPEKIVVSTGAKQSLFNVVMSLVDPDDEVIIPAPYWVSYPAMVQLAGGKTISIPTTVEHNYKITPAQLEAAISDKTKLFIFSSPCNPTGSLYSKQELEALAKVFSKHPNVFIISDEIYELINFSGRHESITQFKEISDRVVIINGVSKGFAMTGWRLGYMAAPIKEIAQACEKYQGQITSGTCTISQKAAIDAVLTNPEECTELKNMLQVFEKRRDIVLKHLADIKQIKTGTPEGAFYVFPDMSAFIGLTSNAGQKINNDVDLAMYLLDEAKVATVPGSAFGTENCIRLSYATSEELLNKAFNSIKEALNSLK